ncbi:hypothetical protein D9619_004917 [Psilocybe cf. subviscida]|uniref:Uncharacterized protein n=1 Tax=Psilocybe cf. subviscida TaxID=2480587 RepID=A0A8H5BRG7_9AGAR|nr:hypothetical protein D9619_004917 [Psilocybe cf. subviscida]
MADTDEANEATPSSPAGTLVLTEQSSQYPKPYRYTDGLYVSSLKAIDAEPSTQHSPNNILLVSMSGSEPSGWASTHALQTLGQDGMSTAPKKRRRLDDWPHRFNPSEPFKESNEIIRQEQEDASAKLYACPTHFCFHLPPSQSSIIFFSL